VGNVLLSLHWHRTDKDDILPFEEIRYYSRHAKWARYKQFLFPTNIKLIKLPPYLTKSTFTDIRDADGGKFVYEELPKLKQIMPVEISETISNLSLEEKAPINVVTMELLENNTIKAYLEFEYDGTRVPFGKLADKTPYVTVKRPEEEIIYWLKRDLKIEQQSFNLLQACKFYPMQTNNIQIEGDDALDFYNFYKSKAGSDWLFEEIGDFSSIKILPDALSVSVYLDFEKTADSFLMQIKMMSGAIEIATDSVIQAFLHGKKYINVYNNGYVEIPLTLILNFTKSLTSFDAQKINGEDIYKIKTYRAGLVNELIEQNVTISMSEKFEKFWNQIKSFNTLEDISKPKGLKADLREYQTKGLNWLWFLYEYGLNGILADDMGLGKTVQALALMQKAREVDKQQPSLVICPTSVVFNWEAEIEKFTPKLKYLNLTGSTRKDSFDQIEKNDIIITSYAILRRDIEELRKYNFRFVILDESQNIKNAESMTAQSAKLLNTQHRIALSGTPIENSINELWSVFDFLMPGFLYDDKEFKSRYAVPIQERQDRLVESKLKKQIYPFILRRMKRDIAKDLPEKVENIAYCTMLPDQKDFYLEVLDSTKKELMAKVQKEGIEKSQMSIFAALLRLRQICCHPKLFDKTGERNIETSGKFEHLKEMLEEIISEGHRILLFSQFVQMLDIVKEWLIEKGIKYEYLTGSTKDRAERVNSFNNDESIPIFLISLKAGGTGLNLTGADYVIHYDPWWNPAVEDQATDRAYRIGQTKNVFVYRFITKNSVEEKIMKLKEKKRDLADTIISVDRSIGKALTYDDLEDIFSLD
jgi:SNF2 family DNA or RNA helicase